MQVVLKINLEQPATFILFNLRLIDDFGLDLPAVSDGLVHVGANLPDGNQSQLVDLISL